MRETAGSDDDEGRLRQIVAELQRRIDLMADPTCSTSGGQGGEPFIHLGASRRAPLVERCTSRLFEQVAALAPGFPTAAPHPRRRGPGARRRGARGQARRGRSPGTPKPCCPRASPRWKILHNESDSGGRDGPARCEAGAHDVENRPAHRARRRLRRAGADSPGAAAERRANGTAGRRAGKRGARRAPRADASRAPLPAGLARPRRPERRRPPRSAAAPRHTGRRTAVGARRRRILVVYGSRRTDSIRRDPDRVRAQRPRPARRRCRCRASRRPEDVDARRAPPPISTATASPTSRYRRRAGAGDPGNVTAQR